MTLTTNDHPIRGLVEGIKAQHGALGSLLEAVINQTNTYDFFNALCSHLMPHLLKSEEFGSLFRKWRRRIGTYRRREKMLREQAIEEVTNALETLSTEIRKTQFSKESQIATLLIQAEEYLNGTRPTCIPPHFEMAADKLADVCRVLLSHRAIQLVEKVAELDGDKLLLIREENEGRKKTALILNEFGGDSNPRRFFERLFQNPRTDVTPADVGMCSNSPANLLKRAKLTKALKQLFFTKGSRKNSIRVMALRIPRAQVPIAIQLELWKQIDELNLNNYKDV